MPGGGVADGENGVEFDGARDFGNGHFIEKIFQSAVLFRFEIWNCGEDNSMRLRREIEVNSKSALCFFFL